MESFAITNAMLWICVIIAIAAVVAAIVNKIGDRIRGDD